MCSAFLPDQDKGGVHRPACPLALSVEPFFLARRKSSTDFERRIVRLVRNEHVHGLVDLMLDEGTPAAYQKAALEGLIEIDLSTGNFRTLCLGQLEASLD